MIGKRVGILGFGHTQVHYTLPEGEFPVVDSLCSGDVGGVVSYV